jgi:AP-2 complex subunit alpha
MVRLTIRATDETVAPVILKLMVDRISSGVSTEAAKHMAPTPREISDAFGNIMVA